MQQLDVRLASVLVEMENAFLIPISAIAIQIAKILVMSKIALILVMGLWDKNFYTDVLMELALPFLDSVILKLTAYMVKMKLNAPIGKHIYQNGVPFLSNINKLQYHEWTITTIF